MFKNKIFFLFVFLLFWDNIFIGLILFVEEENYGRNADLITKHFIAEGVVSDHSILIADVERKPEATVIFFSIVYFD